MRLAVKDAAMEIRSKRRTKSNLSKKETDKKRERGIRPRKKVIEGGWGGEGRGDRKRRGKSNIYRRVWRKFF